MTTRALRLLAQAAGWDKIISAIVPGVLFVSGLRGARDFETLKQLNIKAVSLSLSLSLPPFLSIPPSRLLFLPPFSSLLSLLCLIVRLRTSRAHITAAEAHNTRGGTSQWR